MSVPNTMDFLDHNNKILQEAVAKAQANNKRAFDNKRRGELNLQLGDQVWLSTTNLKLRCPSKKLAPKFIGPFLVKKK